MHEANFTEQIVNVILAELDKVPEGRPSRIKVNVGEMLHLNCESVQAHFGILAKGTNLEGVELELDEIPVRLKCRTCGWKGIAEDHHILMCYACNGMEVDVTSGRDVTIESIEVSSSKRPLI